MHRSRRGGRVGGGVVDGFDRAAATYDRLVGANPGYHAHLRLSARRLGLPGDGAGMRVLDLGCGTGASTAALLATYPAARVVAVDASEGMLARARAKSWPPGVSFVHARAEDLASAGIAGPFDGVFAAYLVRNLADPDQVLTGLRDLLRPGGALAVHEYTLVDSPVARAVWTAVCWGIVVPAGKLTSGDARLYRYLWRSVLDFDDAAGFAHRLARQGFCEVEMLPLPGWQHGITHTFVARRPVAPGLAAFAAWRPGRDRRAVRHRAPAGRRSAGTTRPHVAVIGGGIAGISAAVALVERGVEVDLFEREPYLGGRVGGWPTTLRDGTAVTMSRGFHAFFRQYYNLRAVLRRAGPGRLTPLPDYPLLHADGHLDRFAGLPRTPPWNAVGFAARSRTFGLRELLGTNARVALGLLDVSVPEVYRRFDDQDAASLLDEIAFPRPARELAFRVFSRSFFADPRELSAAELATMFHLYFLGSAEGLLFDVPAGPFPQTLWDPLAGYLRRAGASVRLGAPVAAIEPTRVRDATRYVVHRGDGKRDGTTTPFDAVVLAADVTGLQRLVEASDRLGTPAWRDRIAGLRTAPPFAVSRFWLDRPVRPDRPGFLGTAGFGPVDNVSVLDRFESEARAWAARNRGAVVEVHAYALPGPVAPADIGSETLGWLHRIYPETAHARVVDARHEVRADCPLFAPGSFRDRPTVRTPDPGVVLAGDLVRVDHPVALMERAATSGLLAANAVLERWGIRGHVLWTVPNEGRLRPLRGLLSVRTTKGRV